MTAAVKVFDASLARMSDDEVALMYHVGMWGSDGYPVERIGRRWRWRAWRSVSGSPETFGTKRQAVAAFESWMNLARARWAQMKREDPGIIATAVGILEAPLEATMGKRDDIIGDDITGDDITDAQIKSVRLAAVWAGDRQMSDDCAIALEIAPDQDEDGTDGELTLNAWVHSRSRVADVFNARCKEGDRQCLSHAPPPRRNVPMPEPRQIPVYLGVVLLDIDYEHIARRRARGDTDASQDVRAAFSPRGICWRSHRTAENWTGAIT